MTLVAIILGILILAACATAGHLNHDTWKLEEM